jgi:hypothetical protein
MDIYSGNRSFLSDHIHMRARQMTDQRTERKGPTYRREDASIFQAHTGTHRTNSVVARFAHAARWLSACDLAQQLSSPAPLAEIADPCASPATRDGRRFGRRRGRMWPGRLARARPTMRTRSPRRRGNLLLGCCTCTNTASRRW